ncbi:unnamed protein product [Aphanomyces euteiches]
MSLPLPEGFFVCPPLSAETKQQYIQLSRRICEETILNAMALQRAPIKRVLWSPKTNRQAIIRQAPYAANRALDAICSYTQLVSSIDEIADFFRMDNRVKLRTYGEVLGQTFVDRQLLYTIVDTSNRGGSTRKVAAHSNPFHFVSIEWWAAEVKLPGLFSNRDICVLEAQDVFEFVDANTHQRRRGFIRAYNSIEIDGCPSLKKSHGLIRGELHRSGHIFIETDVEGTFDFFHILVVKSNGYAPRIASNAFAQRQCARILHLEEYFQTQRVISNMEKQTLQRISSIKSSNAHCERCQRQFGFFVKKNYCRQCNAVVCWGCSFKLKLQASFNFMQVCVCLHCFNNGITTRKALSPYSTLSTSAVSTAFSSDPPTSRSRIVSASSPVKFDERKFDERKFDERNFDERNFDERNFDERNFDERNVEKLRTPVHHGQFDFISSPMSSVMTGFSKTSSGNQSSFSAYLDTVGSRKV